MFNPICLLTFKGHTYSIRSLVSHKGYLYSGSSDKTIKKWSEDGQCLLTIKGHTAPICSLVSYKGYLYSGSRDSTIKKWGEDGQCLLTIKDHTYYICSLVSHKGHLYSGSSDYTIKKWFCPNKDDIYDFMLQYKEKLITKPYMSIYYQLLPELKYEVIKFLL